jgi:hypothetical protein
MKIEIENLCSVVPNFRGGGHSSNLIIDVILCPHQAERLFYDIWSEYEGGKFEEWIRAEGYELVKKDRASEQHLTTGSTVPAQEPSPKLPEQNNNGVR